MSFHHPDRINRIVTWLIRYRVWVLSIASLLAIVAGWRTAKTYAALRSDLEELLPQSAPSVVALQATRERIDGVRHLGVVVETGGPNNVPAASRFLDDLASRIRKYPPEIATDVHVDVTREREFAETYALQLMDPKDVARVREAIEARRDWKVSRAMGTDLLDDDEDPAPTVPIAELREKYEKRFGKAHKFPNDRLVAEDGQTAVLLVQASSHATSYEADNALIDRVRGDVESLGFPNAYAANMRVGYAGDVATRVEEMEGLIADLSMSGALVLLLVVGSIFWFFRSWRALPILGVPLAFGTVYTFALAALPPFSIHHLNSNTAFLGTIVVGNGINTGIILLARFREERWRGLSIADAIPVAVRTTWRPTLAAAGAASLAYGSLVVTDFRGFNQFGWIGGVGMVTCWAATLLLAPIIISLVGSKITVPKATFGQGMGRRFAGFMLRHSRAVVVATAAISILAAWGVTRRHSDWLETDFSKLRRSDSWETGERYWGKRMDSTLKRYLTPTVVMADNAVAARSIEKRILKLQQEGRAGGLIAQVRSSTQLLPPDRAQSVEEAKKLKAVLTPSLKKDLSPEDRNLVERALSDESLAVLEPSQVPGVLATGLRETSGRVDRNILVFPKLTEGTWDADRMAAFTHDVRGAAIHDGKPMPVTGSLLLSSDIVSAMKSDGPRASAIALGAVLLIAVVAFRALGLSIAAMSSLLVGVLLMLGGMAWSQMRLNFSNFVALPITFGIGADYAINVLKRYQADGKLDLHGAMASTGGAVALCSATTIIGFGSLLVAQNQALFSFGVFAVAGEFACLATAILALPAALKVIDDLRKRKSASLKVEGPESAGHSGHPA